MLKTYFEVAGKRGVALILAGLFTVCVMVYVPVDDFGRFSLAMAFIQTLDAAFLSLGNHALLRFGRERFSQVGEVGESLSARLMLFSFVVVFLLGLIWMMRFYFPAGFQFGDFGLLIISIGLIIVPISEIGTYTAQTTGRYAGYGMGPVIMRTVQLSVLLGFVFYHNVSWYLILLGTLFGHLLAGVYTWLQVPRSAIRLPAIQRKFFKRFLRFGWSIPFATLSMTLVATMDLWFLQIFSTTEAVGSYAWAYSISLMAAALLAPLGAVIAPGYIDALSAKQTGHIGNLVRSSYGFVNLAITLVPAIISGVILLAAGIDFGNYQSAVIPGLILIGATTFQLGSNIWDTIIFSSEGRVSRGVAVLVGTAVINALGDLILVPDFGGTGAAIATALAMLFSACGLYLIVQSDVVAEKTQLPYGLIILGASMVSAVIVMANISVIYGAALGCGVTGLLIGVALWRGDYAGLAVLDLWTGKTESNKLISWAVGFLERLGSFGVDRATWFYVENRVKYTASAKPQVKIQFVVNQLSVGGTERHLLQILAKLKERQFDVSVLVLKGGGRLEESFHRAGISVISPNPTLSNFIQRIWGGAQVVKIIFIERPDIIHFFLPEAYLVGGVISALCRQRLTIMSRRSLNIYQKRYPVAARIERWLHKRTTVLVGNSKAVIGQLHNEAADSSKIELIYNGIDQDLYKGIVSKSEAREELDIAQNAIVFVIVANLISYKGHEDLITALRDIKERLPQPWTLLCLGRDEGIGGKLLGLTNEYGLVQNIQWLGETPDVPKYLAAADIGLLCSHEEGFSNSILEGMACSLPLIVTDVGGNAEAVVDGKTGIVVPPRTPLALGEAILKLALDEELRIKLGKAAQIRVESEFSLENCVGSYAQMYNGLVQGDSFSVPEIFEHEPIA